MYYDDDTQGAYNDLGSPKFAVAAAHKLAKNGTKFVIGHPLSAYALATSDIYADNGVLVIHPAATIPELTARGHQLSFRTVGTNISQASVACDWIAEQVNPDPERKIAGLPDDMVSMIAQKLKPGAKIAVLHDNQIYGEGIASLVKQGLKTRGIDVHLYEGITSGARRADHSTTIERLAQGEIDFVYFGGYSPDLTRLLPQARAAGIRAKFMSSDAAVCSVYSARDIDTAEGLLLTSPGRFRQPHHKAMTREMEDEKPTGLNFTEPTSFLTYAAFEVLAQAIEAAGDCEDTGKIAQAIRSGTFDTTAGSLSFQPNGDLTSPRFDVEECVVKRKVVRFWAP